MDKAVFFLMTNVTIMVCLFHSLPHPTASTLFLRLASPHIDFQRGKEKKSQCIDANGLK